MIPAIPLPSNDIAKLEQLIEGWYVGKSYTDFMLSLLIRKYTNKEGVFYE